MMTNTRTLIELLRGRTHNGPTGEAYTFLHDGDCNVSTMSYAQLDQKARAIAASMQAQQLRGHCALLVFPPGLDFIAAFWGCLYAGVIAVPVPVLRPRRPMGRFEAILSDSNAAVVMTTADTLSRLEPMIRECPQLKALPWIATDQIAEEGAQDWVMPSITAETIALLQYTSGSTALPKGVMVSHNNLLHNSALIQTAFHNTTDCRMVSWLPFHHDMGLIGGVLQPLYVGCPIILMSPASFMKCPLRWLQVITRYEATTSGGPNFAYEACIRSIPPELIATLDLSHWRAAFTGAEPIRADTLRRFANIFQPAGFHTDAFLPCYGLAESTLMVTAKARTSPRMKMVHASSLQQNKIVEVHRGDPEGHQLVSSGRVYQDQSVAIVNPRTFTRCSADEVGEIWIAGPSVAQGYWNKPDESHANFGAIIHETGEGPYFRSGDLGFWDDGELYVTGRLKDMLIIKGRNYYPQDIEWTVTNCDPSLSGEAGAAFSVEVSNEERLVLVQEVNHRKATDLNHLVGKIRLAIAREHELEVSGITFIKAGSLHKTTSGKIERHTCKASYLAGTLKSLGGWHGLPEACPPITVCDKPQSEDADQPGHECCLLVT